MPPRKYFPFFIILGLIPVLAACRTPTPSPAELALHHAPIHYQDTDNTLAEADYLTRFDYDGDWDALNNWENLETGDLSGAVYFSVVETCTHWFIVYGFYHPRDWTDTIEQEHENDMEGLLEIVRKDGGKFGTLEGMVTVFHNDFYSFTPTNSRFRDGEQDIDGEIAWDSIWFTPHPLTSAEAEGHGLKIWPLAGHFQGDRDQDGVIYFPSEDAPEIPRNGNDRAVNYQLISFFAPDGFWSRQLSEATTARDDALTFATWGTLKGDDDGGCGHGPSVCKFDAAHLPWEWDDHNDDPIQPGEMALDPANLVLHYFGNLGEFSTVYVSNPYLEGLREAGFGEKNLPWGWPEGLDLDKLFGKMGGACK
ncbi:MAG: hypothetical protein H6636_00230 [Anaerolineales bacterium]|nr:hypothetical protein [Anaerolineales bacterium]